MRLTLNRHPSGLTCTIGDLLVDGELLCHTLELAVPLIPAGTYKVLVTKSERALKGELWSPYNGTLPILVDVPDHEGIRIHAGNTSSDTRGCVLVGSWVGGEQLIGSRDALTSLMVQLINADDAGQEIDIDVCAP